MQAIRHFLLALQYFTRIPLHGRIAAWVGFSPAMQRASLAYFPGVGWVIGGIAGSSFYLLAMALPSASAAPWVAVALSTVLTVLLTGALHEDGLADLADGLGGTVSRERALEIMKDSRIGSYGTTALVLGLSVKMALVTLLGQVDVGLAAWALFAAHVSSRLMPLFLVALLPNVGADATSKSRPLTRSIGMPALCVALFWTALALLCTQAGLPGFFWIWAVGGCALACLTMWRLLGRRLQGYTGDALGATQQVCELAFYLGLLLGLPAGAGR